MNHTIKWFEWQDFRFKYQILITKFTSQLDSYDQIIILWFHFIMFDSTLRTLKCRQQRDPIENNGSQLKNPDISGAIFTSGLSILLLNSFFEEGARDVRV